MEDIADDSPVVIRGRAAIQPSQIIVEDDGDDSDAVVVVESYSQPARARVAAYGASRPEPPSPTISVAKAPLGGVKRSRAPANREAALEECADKPSSPASVQPPKQRGPTSKQLQQQHRSLEHALQRAATGKLSSFETAVCLRSPVLESELGRLLQPALALENFAILPPPPAESDAQRPNVITWHRLALDVGAIAHAAAAKAGGTLAAASSAAALIDVRRAVSSATSGVAGSAAPEPFAAVIWSGDAYLRELVAGGTDGLERFVSDVRRGVAAAGPAGGACPPCHVVFVVEGLARALAAVDQRSKTARYVTSDAVEHAHTHLYLQCALEVTETASATETAEFLVTMTRAIAEKPYKARTSAFAHVPKKKTRAAAFAPAAMAAAPNPEDAFLGSGDDGAPASGEAGSATALDTWLGALQMVPMLSEAKAVRVAAAYPTLRSLQRAFLAADATAAPRLLEVRWCDACYSWGVKTVYLAHPAQDVFDGKRKLAKLSSILHVALTQRSPDEAAAVES